MTDKNTFFSAMGLPDPFGDDLKHGSGLPKPQGDFGYAFDHLFDACLVSIITALTETLRELLFPSRAGFSAKKISGKAATALIAYFTARRIFHRWSFEKREKSRAIMEKPGRDDRLEPAQSA